MRDAMVDDVTAPDAGRPDAAVAFRMMVPDASAPRAFDGGRAPRAVHVAPTTPDGTQELVATRAGLLLVRVVEHPGQRAVDLVATPLDAEGTPLGEPRLLRRTTGPVVSLSASVAGDHLWVSWITDRPQGHDGATDTERLSAALHAKADLSTVDAPVTFEDTRIRTTENAPCGWWESGATRVFAREDGAALVVATGGLGTCLHSHSETGEGDERICCGVWNEFRVAADGRFSTRAESMIAPYGAPEGFARVPGGVVYAVSNEHEFRNMMFVTASYALVQPIALPQVGAAFAHDQVVTAWTGDGVAAMGVLQLDFEDEHGRPPPRGFVWWERSGRPKTPDGPEMQGRVAWAPFTRDPLRCVEGHPVVTVRWRGTPAGTLTLDPTRTDQDFDLAEWANLTAVPLPPPPAELARDTERVSHLVWTGRALVGLVDGAITRWHCAPTGRLLRVP